MGDSSGQKGKLRIMVSVPPLANLVRKVGGKHVHVDVLVDNGQAPHTFSQARCYGVPLCLRDG
ncbi:MAG: zinc ABC transporter solute-binding protein [Verrucomicrobiaceae bacterium]|nr:zinc ABC transporter solute-binding protein [Verrucomicrobiaceae bacterium]